MKRFASSLKPFARFSSSVKGLPFIVFAISLLLTFLAAFSLCRVLNAKHHAHFNSLSEEDARQIASNVETHITLLRGVAGLFHASVKVTEEEFHSYVQGLRLEEHYPGIQAIGFARRVFKADETVWPTGQRDEYYAVSYIEPRNEQNRSALGYDMRSETVRRQMMEEARDTGLPMGSGKVRLIQETRPGIQPGYLIVLPVYKQSQGGNDTLTERRKNLLGFVYGAYRMTEFFSHILEGDPYHPRFTIYDGAAADPEKILFTSVARKSEGETHPRWRRRIVLSLAGRPWLLGFVSTPEFEADTEFSWVWLVLISGILISLCLFGVTRREERARRKSEENERYFHTLCEVMPQIVWTADKDGTIDYKNQKWSDYSSLKDVSKIDWLAILAEEDMEKCHGAWKQALSRCEAFEIECRLKCAKTGLGRWHLVRGIPFKDESGDVIKWFGTYTDIDDQKRAQEKTIESNRRLVELTRLKSDFTSMVSHELRTPLSAIKEALGLLEDEVEGPVNAGQQETLGIAKGNVDRLHRLINNILDYSRIESGGMEFHFDWNDLNAIARETHKTMALAARKKRQKLFLELPGQPLIIRCDADKIKQVLINLLDNAMKFTHEGGEIALSVKSASDLACIDVQDSGMGIRTEDTDKIFKMYGQSLQGARYSGAGVGLAVCKMIVEAHGGTIAVQSVYGKGATFRIALPVEMSVRSGVAG